jgi:hypothetical protein
MKVVRIFWGDNIFTKYQKEIINSPRFEDEIVYVWGKDNESYFKSIGYDTYLVSEKNSHPKYSNISTFLHKIFTLSIIENHYNEFLFLDWDIHLFNNRTIDKDFYNLIRLGSDLQVPLYSYSLTYKEDILEKIKQENIESNYLKYILEFIDKQQINIEKFSWKVDDMFVLPCFCFYYSRIKLAKDLLKICKETQMETIVDEFSLYLWFSGTLNEYINKHEPFSWSLKDS